MAHKNKMSLKEFKRIVILAESKNFSDLHTVNEEGRVEFDVGDGGIQSESMYQQLEADFLLLDILAKLNDRQKVILLYQVLRQAGFNFNHEDCAKTLSLSREQYMFNVRQVKDRSAKILNGNTTKLSIMRDNKDND